MSALYKFQSDATIWNTNLTVSSFHQILRYDVLSDIETGPDVSFYFVHTKKPSMLHSDKSKPC